MATTRSVIFACTLLGFASTVNASPFSINLVGTGSESEGSGYAGSGGGGGSHGSNAVAASDSAALAALGLAMGAPSAGGTGVRPTVAGIISTPNVVDAIHGEPVAQLDLGNGESLSVAGDVAESLAAILSSSERDGDDDAPASTAQTHSVANAVTDSTHAGGAPSEVLNAVITKIATGIVSQPGEITNASPAAVGGAAEPAHAPEPATLLLFASALAFAGRRLRRRRHHASL